MYSRCDTSAASSVYSRAGGVLISVRSIYFSEQISVFGADNLEIVFFKVQLNVFLYICCLYVPPSSDNDTYHRLSVVFECFLAIVQRKLEDII